MPLGRIARQRRNIGPELRQLDSLAARNAFNDDVAQVLQALDGLGKVGETHTAGSLRIRQRRTPSTLRDRGENREGRAAAHGRLLLGLPPMLFLQVGGEGIGPGMRHTGIIDLMRLLRLRQFAEGAVNCRVTIELDGAGARRSAESRFAFQLTAQDRHYSEAIRLREAQGDLYDAAQIRYNVAIALTKGGRFPDARQYANTALRDFQTYGSGAAAMVEKTLDLYLSDRQGC